MPNRIVYWIMGLQLLILAGMFVKAFYPLAIGKDVVLKVIPVDPRDIFRGDYAALNYNMGSLLLDSIPNDLDRNARYQYGDQVYVTLEQKGRFYEPTGVWGKHPEQAETVILGIVEYYDHYNHQLSLRYGIETFFANPEKAKMLEDLVSWRNADSVTVYVKVSVTSGGAARIRSIHCDEAGF